MEIVWEARGAFKWNEAKARDQLMRAMTKEVVPEDSTEVLPQDSSPPCADEESLPPTPA